MVKTNIVVWFSVSLLAGCNVSNTSESTGGVNDGAHGKCPAGTTIVMSDYVSTQIALSDLDGNTLSESFFSTASSLTDGLAYALSGDVILPSSRPKPGQVVLLDRYGTNVVTWLDTASAGVIAQLPIGTGFESNPADYIEIDGGRALLTRWGQNAAPGQEPFDDGGDVLIVDLGRHEIVGSVVIPIEDGLPPRPSALTRSGEEIFVTLDRLSDDYATVGYAKIVALDAHKPAIRYTLTLDGLKACSRLAPSADGTRLALACTGALSPTGETEDLSQSALVILDATASPLRELARYTAESIAGEPLQGDVVFASANAVLLKTQTALGGGTHNRWLSFNLDARTTTELLRASPDVDGTGKGLVYGGMVCAPGCSTTCLLADGDRGVLARASVDAAGTVTLRDAVSVESRVGLPPKDVGFR